MEPKIYSVKQFNEVVNLTLQEAVGEVMVEGEISGYQLRQGKWVSFDLKDEDSVINCFTSIYQLDFPLADGQSVVVTGTPRIYVPYGKYSLNIRNVQLRGEGNLKKAYEELKAKLESEGLFAPEHKLPIPQYPETIGVITSGEGAAINDILKVINGRWGGLSIFLAPVLVQGKNAPDELVGALEYFNKHHPVDVLIFGRGGGSLEDLQAFNSERVARAIFSSRIPIIAGIGHEHNTSIADLVADIRAATPSNAAEICVPDRKEVASQISFLRHRAEQRVNNQIVDAKQTAYRAKQNLGQAMSLRINSIRVLIQSVKQSGEMVFEHCRQYRTQLPRTIQQLTQSSQSQLERSRTSTLQLKQLLSSLSPTRVLARGYSITYNQATGRPITRLNEVPAYGRVKTQVQDGSFESEIPGPTGSTAKPPRKQSKIEPTNQLSLTI